MFLCYVCKAHHKSSTLLFKYLRLQHGLYPGKRLCLKCGQPGCCLSFCTYSGFKKHLVHSHGDVAVTNTDDNVDMQNEYREPSTSEAITDSPTTQLSVNNNLVLNMCASVVAQLQASGVDESTVQAMVGSMEDLVNDIHTQAKEAVLSCTTEIQGTDFEKKVEKCFDELENPFSTLNTSEVL